MLAVHAFLDVWVHWHADEALDAALKVLHRTEAELEGAALGEKLAVVLLPLRRGHAAVADELLQGGHRDVDDGIQDAALLEARGQPRLGFPRVEHAELARGLELVTGEVRQGRGGK